MSSMEQNANAYTNDAAPKDAQTTLIKEEYVLSMEQNAKDAASKDARTMLNKVECAINME